MSGRTSAAFPCTSTGKQVPSRLTMFSSTLFRFLAAATLFAIQFIGVVHSAPTSGLNATAFEGLDHQARDILARATPAAPHFAIYSDKWVSSSGPPSPSTINVRKATSLHIDLTNQRLNFTGLQRIVSCLHRNFPPQRFIHVI